IVGMGPGDLRFQRDARSQSIGTVEGDAPQLLAIRLGAWQRAAQDRRGALGVAAVDALETEGPGVDRVAGAAAEHPAVVAWGGRRCRIAGLGVVFIVGARHADFELAEAQLQAALVPGRPLV